MDDAEGCAARIIGMQMEGDEAFGKRACPVAPEVANGLAGLLVQQMNRNRQRRRILLRRRVGIPLDGAWRKPSRDVFRDRQRTPHKGGRSVKLIFEAHGRVAFWIVSA